MKRSRFSEEQVAYALRQAEAGTAVGDVCRQLGISEATFYVWRKRFGHLGVNEVRRVRQLEDENAGLKRLVADLTLDKHMLAEARLGVLRRAYRLGKMRIDPAHLDFTDLFLPENSPRGRYITADAFVAIHKGLPDYLKDLFEFAYLCGTRKQQLCRTTWAHWNEERGVLSWNPEEVKSKEPHVLPLDGRPLEIILAKQGARVLHCPYVFHGARCEPGAKPTKAHGCVGNFKRAWMTACKKAGFPVGRKHGGYVFHNTRHTAVTNLVNASVPAHEAMAVSGHRTRSVFDRYSIRVEEQTRAALRQTTAYTQGLRTARKVVPLNRNAG